jgi:hypothetical protein
MHRHDAQPTRDRCHRVVTLGHRLDRLDLEFFRVSLAAQNTFISQIVRRGSGYRSGGGDSVQIKKPAENQRV